MCKGTKAILLSTCYNTKGIHTMMESIKIALGFIHNEKSTKTCFEYKLEHFKTMALSFCLAFLEIDILDQVLKSEKCKLVLY